MCTCYNIIIKQYIQEIICSTVKFKSPGNVVFLQQLCGKCFTKVSKVLELFQYISCIGPTELAVALSGSAASVGIRT